ncbi:MAG: 50S ribosomal protein L9 [Patescibacteria group bacterium]
MKVVFLQDVKGVGRKRDIKDVSEGYAKNFLIPRGLAKVADEKIIKNIEKEKILMKTREDNLDKAKEIIIKKLNGKEFHFYAETGEHREVFKPITKNDIYDAVKKSLDFILEKTVKEKILEKTRVNMIRSLKELGEHEIEINLGGDKRFKILAIINQVAITENSY